MLFSPLLRELICVREYLTCCDRLIDLHFFAKQPAEFVAEYERTAERLNKLLPERPIPSLKKPPFAMISLDLWNGLIPWVTPGFGEFLRILLSTTGGLKELLEMSSRSHSSCVGVPEIVKRQPFAWLRLAVQYGFRRSIGLRALTCREQSSVCSLASALTPMAVHSTCTAILTSMARKRICISIQRARAAGKKWTLLSACASSRTRNWSVPSGSGQAPWLAMNRNAVPVSPASADSSFFSVELRGRGGGAEIRGPTKMTPKEIPQPRRKYFRVLPVNAPRISRELGGGDPRTPSGISKAQSL
jgi:hypothetical protein